MNLHFTPRRIVGTQAFALALALAFGTGLAGAMALAQEAQGDVAIDVQQHDATVIIRASAIVDTDAATAWRVLTDYGRYREFVPGLRTSRVLARAGPQVTVEQSGVAPLWLLSVPMTITYDIVESPPARLRSRATIPGAGVLHSSYALVPTDAGLQLVYLGTIAITPGPMTALREGAAERAIEGHFRALADEMERRSKRLGPRMATGPQAGNGATAR